MKKYVIVSVLAVLASISVASAQQAAQGYTFNSDLSLGSQGEDVANLQNWLLQNGFSIPAIANGGAPGYFGPQTQAALEAYQRSVGLPAYGYFGPMTRGWIYRHRVAYQGSSLQVTSPNRGEVWQTGTMQNITWTVPPAMAGQTADIRLEFPLPACAQPGQPIRCMIMVRAPYLIVKGAPLTAGSYAWKVGSVTDLNGSNPTVASDGQYKVQICPSSGSQCVESDNEFTIASSPTPTPTPTPTATPSPSIQVTYPNGGETLTLGNTYTIAWKSANIGSSQVSISLHDDSKYCPAGWLGCWTDYGIAVVNDTGSYAWNTSLNMSGDGGPNSVPVTPGSSYRIKICDASGNICGLSAGEFSIVASQPGSQSPVISGIDAPTALAVGQTGTWTVHASDPQNGALSYSVDWGDSQPGYAPSAQAAWQFVQTATFTHTYSYAGTYTVRFTVRDSQGLTAQSSATVNVGSSQPSQNPSVTVLSPNGGEIWAANSTQNILWSLSNYSPNALVDINLGRLLYPPCAYNPNLPNLDSCKPQFQAQYVLDRNVSANIRYGWIVGTDISNNPIPAGQYAVQVCRAGSTTDCDASNQPFTIIGTAVPYYPPANPVYCPPGYTCTVNR
ncbi:peptidoglycan-binding protein [Patescibacteria group bacterium]|nr:peptidoglycan-binding protein [Patescibacteria group bacterium]